ARRATPRRGVPPLHLARHGPLGALSEPVGPLQLVLIGFETTDRFRGDIAGEIADLRGRGMIRVLDARLFVRGDDGALTEVALNPLLAGPPPCTPGAALLGTHSDN